MALSKSGKIIFAAILAIFVYGMIAAMLGTLMPTLPLDTDQKGYVAFAQAIGLIIASVSAGPLVDNLGKKPALVAGLALIALSLFGIGAQAPAQAIGTPQPTGEGYGMYLALFLVLGLGGGTIVTAANTLVSDISEERRATTLNFLNLFFGLGGLATPFVAANLLGGDTRNLLYLGGALTVLTLVAHATAPVPPPSGERGFRASEIGVVTGRPALWLLALFLFLYVACEVGVWNWLAQYLVSQGIDEKRALNVLSLGFALGLLVGRVVVSRILIKVPAPTVTLFASVLMAITTYLMLGTSDYTISWIAVFCAGLAMAPVFPTTLAMVGDAFPRMTATAMGIVITFGWIGLAVSSPIIGRIAAGSTLQSALLVLPVFSVAMIVVNLALRPMLKRPALAPAS
ncbi:MAG: MFS transporter [Acidobacteria bacterium]|nr:MFS transporter [Acidobacteriota bacterium]